MSIWKKPVDIPSLDKAYLVHAHSDMGISFVSVDENSIAVQMAIDQKNWNPFGTLHGGMSAFLAESVANSAADRAVDDEHYCVCIDLNINHLKSTKTGTLIATARAISIGRTLHVWGVEIFDTTGRQISVARLTFFVMDKS